MKAKGPAAAKVEEEKKKGLALFGPKPPTPKLLRAFGGTINRKIIDKMKVSTLPFLSICEHIKAIGAMLTAKRSAFCISFPSLLMEASEDRSELIFYDSFLGADVEFYFHPLIFLLYQVCGSCRFKVLFQVNASVLP